MFTLGRDLDIQYPTNRLIIIIAALTAIIAILISGDFLTGFKMGAGIFLTWVLGREAEPKREYSAFVSVVIALIFTFMTDAYLISFLEILIVILLLRMINRTSGKKSTPVDAGVTLAVVAYHFYIEKNPVYIFIYLIGLFISQIFKDQQLSKVLTGIAAMASFVYLFYLFINQATFSSPLLSPISLTIVLFLYGITSYLDHERNTYDDQGNLIDSVYIARAQLFFVFIVFVISFLTEPVFANMLLYFSAMVGTILYRPLNNVFQFEK